MRRSVILAGVMLALAGAASAAPGDELAGNSLQVRMIGSPLRSVLQFSRGGHVLVTTMHGTRPIREDGRWTVRGGRICFERRRSPDECWTYPSGLRMNHPVPTARTDGSMRAVATLVAGHTAGPPR